MKIEINDSKLFLNLEFLYRNNSNTKVILFLHGFTGCAADWLPVSSQMKRTFDIAALDLTGHGKSSSPESVEHYTQSALTSQIKEIINNFDHEKVILAGYSMGGRAALSYAVEHPDNIDGLILESCTAGINEVELRAERAKEDEQLADFIESHSMEEFINYWMNLDIFNTQRRFSDQKLDEIKRTKMNNNKTGLANTLRGFSTGKMKPLFNSLEKVRVKTLLITGSLDPKFVSINSRMAKLLPMAKHVKIKNAGHNVHLEKVEEFADVINKFVQTLE